MAREDADLELSDDVSPADVRQLEDRLYEFNRETTGIGGGRGLSILVRAPSGELRAGLTGHTWGGTCVITQLWVHESLRGCGLGRRLVEAAESEALTRRCTQVMLTTHSFQGPDFYRKLGYEVISEWPDYPRGHSELGLRKRLVGTVTSNEAEEMFEND